MMMERRAAPVDRDLVLAQLDFCREKVDALLPRFRNSFPAPSSEGLAYPAQEENFDWTTSFYSGMLWLLWEHTGDKKYLDALEPHLASFCQRVEKPGNVDTHDLGFLYSLSCGPAVLLREDGRARDCFLKAADYLLARYIPKAGIIQAWGDLNDPANRGRMIIDCLLNLPLLYQAARLTGERSYWEMAYSHAKQAQKYLVRPDSTTYHTFYMDVDTGAPRFGRTAQGYSDDSCWARGQAWGVYGSILSYRYTGESKALDTFKRALEFYLTRLPDDLVPCWDMLFQPDSGEPRDSSSAAIVACGLLEAARVLPPGEGAEYERLAREMAGSLAADYAVPVPMKGTGLILHGTYSKKSPYNTCFPEGVDECTSWGDFYYMEALPRLCADWDPYW